MSLILSRKPGEAVLIGDNIVVTVAGVNGNHVRLAFDVPKEIRVDRSEVRDRILAEKAAL